MRTRTTALSLLLASALTVSACSPSDTAEPDEPAETADTADSAESAETADPAESAVSAETPEDTPESSQSPERGESVESAEADETMSTEDFEAGGSELAGQTMQQWLLAEGELPDDAQGLLYQLTDRILRDPTIEWLDEGREHAGETSELIPFAYPAFDSYTPNFRSDESGDHFQAIALRVDHASIMDMITGLSYASDMEDSPTTPGILMSASDDDYFYMIGLLDLNQVDREGDINEWRQDYLSEIFLPIDVWRTSVEQAA